MRNLAEVIAYRCAEVAVARGGVILLVKVIAIQIRGIAALAQRVYRHNAHAVFVFVE